MESAFNPSEQHFNDHPAKVYTLAEASELLKVHTITIRRLIKRKLLRRVVYIRDIRIPAGDIDRLVNNLPVDFPKQRAAKSSA